MAETIIHILRVISIVWAIFWFVCFLGPLVFIFAKVEEIKRKRNEETMVIEDDDMVDTAPSYLLALIFYNPYFHFLSLVMSILALVFISLGGKIWIYVALSCFSFVLFSFIFFGMHLRHLFFSNDNSPNSS